MSCTRLSRTWPTSLCEVGPGDGHRRAARGRALQRGDRGDRRLCHVGVGVGLCARTVERCDLHGDRSGRMDWGLAGDRGRRDDRERCRACGCAELDRRRCCEVGAGDGHRRAARGLALGRRHRGDRRGSHERVGIGLCARATERSDLDRHRSGCVGRGDGCDLRGARRGVAGRRRPAEGDRRRCCEVGPGDDDGRCARGLALGRGHRGDRRGSHERVGVGLCPRAVEACHLHGHRSGGVGRGLAGDRGRRDDHERCRARGCPELGRRRCCEVGPGDGDGRPTRGLALSGDTEVTVGAVT